MSTTLHLSHQTQRRVTTFDFAQFMNNVLPIPWNIVAPTVLHLSEFTTTFYYVVLCFSYLRLTITLFLYPRFCHYHSAVVIDIPFHHLHFKLSTPTFRQHLFSFVCTPTILPLSSFCSFNRFCVNMNIRINAQQNLRL